MILGTGIDVVAIDRIQTMYDRHGDRLLRHLLTPIERDALGSLGAPVPRIAGRFAAKEAIMKALGTGWGQGVNFTQIEIVNAASGAPNVRLKGSAAERCRQLGGRRWHVSISHCREVAVAQAVLED